MALWCREFPVVTVQRTETARNVTLIVPYYENPVFLGRQLEHWASFGALRDHLSIIVVDDGSPDYPAADVVAVHPPAHRHRIRVFRIHVDLRWNWLAARNIGFHHADEGWCLVTDIDHVVPRETLETCLYGLLHPRVAYAFSRREHTGEPVAPHSASFLMTRSLFWATGGYDERGSGYYGNDGPFRRKLTRVAKIQILTDELVRHEYVADSSTSRYLRKQPEDARLRTILAQPGPPKVLSFPYSEVTP